MRLFKVDEPRENSDSGISWAQAPQESQAA